MKKFTLLIAGMACALGVSLQAQSISIPYSFGFEDSQSAELANWHINPISATQSMTFASTDSTNRWVVGTAVRNEGRKALYISCTPNGNNAEFGTGTTVMYAYRDIDFSNLVPSGANGASYVLSFDWKCFGTENSTMSACIGIPNQLACVSTVSSSQMTSQEVSACQGGYSMFRQKGQNTWLNERFQFRVSSLTPKLRLMFVWEMNNSDANLANKLGACLDNIQIASANCTAPTDIAVEATCDTTTINWEGYSDSYVVEYRKVGDVKWHTRGNIQGTTSLAIEDLSEGSYDFRVRGVCGSDSSVYTYYNGVNIFCPEEHCINYVDLTGANVHCYYGDFDNPAQNQGVINYGTDSEQSRHTVNWEQGVYDPRTGNQLPLIPQGEMATVRLGNWNDGAEAERIVYDYTPDSATSILLLKYAVVLEDPPSHGASADKFTLEILDDSGNKIDPTCGAEEFTAADPSALLAGTGWHSYTLGSSTAYWKEWTTMGLDLSPYVNQPLHIAVTTYDCDWSAHYGYAYFTLGCASAKIQTVSCGSDTLSIEAPDGFSYEWRQVINGMAIEPVLSRDKNFAAPDTTEFQCHLTQIGKSQCSFDLYSSVIPRFPIADYTWVWNPKNCENRVEFTNLSHIRIQYDGKPAIDTEDPCDDYEWSFVSQDGKWSEESSEKNPTIFFPNTGGDFNVSLKSYIADGACWDIMDTVVHVPAIGDRTLSTDSTICDGDYVLFGDTLRTQTGVYKVIMPTAAGCDSVHVLNLTVNKTLTVTAPDTICYETMQQTHAEDVAAGFTSNIRPNNTLVRYLRSLVTGCDSIVTQPFYPLVQGRVDTAQNADGTVDFTLNTVAATYYTWQYYNEEPQKVAITDSLATVQLKGKIRGTYTFVFYNNGNGCQKDTTITMCNDWIYQRWDDVLSLYSGDALKSKGRDTTYYGFKNFQWYKVDANGQETKIDGATNSYYYAPDGLDMEVSYKLRMTRIADSEEVETCDMIPSQYSTLGAAPVRYRLYTADGILVAESKTKPKTPQVFGIYVMHVDYADGTSKAYTVTIK